MPHHLFGIRHHGPGSARSLLHALTALQPDCVLIEGPPEGDALLALTQDLHMQPPVALLVYAPEQPQQAVYYPFADFSPEWQAIQYALKHHVPVRFMDLPVAMHLAREQVLANAEPAHGPSETAEPDLRADPLALLAQAAGYADSERWWEQMVEERQDSSELFQAILEAMQALRTELDTSAPRSMAAHEREQLREAHMRKTIRQAKQEGFERIAVVCGAWHAPALVALGTAKADHERLRGLPKLKTQATWVPWTYARLSQASGYGAGIEAPGWYAHLWQHAHAPATHWLSKVAQVFREQGVDISSAHIIEAVRLAETLAALRERPLAGLSELNEAVQSVMLFGDQGAMQLLQQQLLIGEVLGQVPDHTPQTPLQQDLSREQKRLRLKPSASIQTLVLDLRKTVDLERSYLLRRLKILNIPWGVAEQTVRGKGTFKESWQLHWQPDMAIRLIEAGYWGNTLETAASQRLIALTQEQTSLATLADYTHDALYAQLPLAVQALMQQLQQQAAVTSDIVHLMQAFPALARLLRYGDVRQTDVAQVQAVVSQLQTRISIGLPNACSALNEEAAEAMFVHIQAQHDAIQLLEHADYNAQWLATLRTLLQRYDLPALLHGRCCRLLLQSHALNESEAAQQLSLALSTGQEPNYSAAWIDGFLRGSGQLLIYDEHLWALVDDWLSQLSQDAFQHLLPVLRRTFSSFTAPERRQMGERVQHGQIKLSIANSNSQLNSQQTHTALAVMAHILGLEYSHAA